MIKVQLQLYSDDEVSKYSSYTSTAIPAVGHTIKIGDKRYEVTSVTWFVPGEFTEDAVNEVHVSAKLSV